MFLEFELVVCVLLDYFEDLDCLRNDLDPICERLRIVKALIVLLPQVRHRHLTTISRAVSLRTGVLTSKNDDIVRRHYCCVCRFRSN
jgi:hypothetical protein